MILQPFGELPHVPPSAQDCAIHTQYAALCYRVTNGKPRILLVTSRGSGRWILPKGRPIPGQTGPNIALTEAWEEAGVTGEVHEGSLGPYRFVKQVAPGRVIPCVAMVYAVRVRGLATHFPEAGQRERRWFRPRKAARRVDEADLAEILRGFLPVRLVL